MHFFSYYCIGLVHLNLFYHTNSIQFNSIPSSKNRKSSIHFKLNTIDFTHKSIQISKSCLTSDDWIRTNLKFNLQTPKGRPSYLTTILTNNSFYIRLSLKWKNFKFSSTSSETPTLEVLYPKKIPLGLTSSTRIMTTTFIKSRGRKFFKTDAFLISIHLKT